MSSPVLRPACGLSSGWPAPGGGDPLPVHRHHLRLRADPRPEQPACAAGGGHRVPPGQRAGAQAVDPDREGGSARLPRHARIRRRSLEATFVREVMDTDVVHGRAGTACSPKSTGIFARARRSGASACIPFWTRTPGSWAFCPGRPCSRHGTARASPGHASHAWTRGRGLPRRDPAQRGRPHGLTRPRRAARRRPGSTPRHLDGLITQFDLLQARQKLLEEERHAERVLTLRRAAAPGATGPESASGSDRRRAQNRRLSPNPRPSHSRADRGTSDPLLRPGRGGGLGRHPRMRAPPTRAAPPPVAGASLGPHARGAPGSDRDNPRMSDLRRGVGGSRTRWRPGVLGWAGVHGLRGARPASAWVRRCAARMTEVSGTGRRVGRAPRSW